MMDFLHIFLVLYLWIPISSAQDSCIAAGFEECCDSNCNSNPPKCYCDQICYQLNDCCLDITQICSPSGDECANCSQLCDYTPGGVVCGCNNGYILDDDGFTCNDVDECTAYTVECYSNLLDQFFPFGDENEDILSQLSDDGSMPISLNTGFVFFGTTYTTVFLNNNGDLSFGAPFRDHYPQQFPISTPLIAPFWTDLFTLHYGNVWYRVTANNDVIQRVTEEVASAFPELTMFVATEVLIATWDDVGYCCSANNQTVTFQCILATDGTNSFVFFLYGNGAIDSVRLSTAQVGLNAGNGIDFVSVDGSLTSSIFNIDGDSNVGCPGVFVYQVNGDVQQPQPGRQCSINSYVDECLNVSLSGCSDICTNTNGSFVCECNTGYQLGDDLMTCSDINECADDTLNDCDQICINTNGSYVCECDSGYLLDDDLITCSDINECSNSNSNSTSSGGCLRKKFFPFGNEADDILSNLGDDSSTSIVLNTGFVFYSTTYTTVFLNNNGDFSFNNGFSDFSPDPFPISTPLIAPFWSDLFTGVFGSLWYRVTRNDDVIDRIREEVASAFPELSTFSATEVLIATWDHVGYCCSSSSPTVTFQCILATDGTNSFVFFLYGDGEINSDFSHSAQVGLNAGNGVDFITVDGSLTSSIFNIDQESNVGCPGVFVFQVNGDARQPQTGRQCSISSYAEDCVDGTSTDRCDQICTNTDGSFVCECNSGYQLDDDLITCSDVDECLDVSLNGCNQICINTNGSFACDCYSGYRLGDDMITCSDIDECADESLNGCNQICNNTDGSFVCECNTGFVLGNDLMTCLGDIVVLPFQEFDANLPVVELPRSSDVSSSVFIGDGESVIGIVIGDTVFTEAHVSDNGIISLERSFFFWQPSLFPTGSQFIQTANVFAAYWGDVDNRVEGTVKYQVFSSGVESGNNRLQIINEYIRESQSTDFTGRWALLVEWSDVHPYDHQYFFNFPFFFQGETADFLSSTNTFQAIIITDVFTTYVIYTYKCGELEWTGPDFRHAVVGYNIPGVGFRNERLSATPGILSIACRNQPFSDIVNIVYPFEANPDLPIMRCLDAYSQDIQVFGQFSPPFFSFFRPACPCSYFQAQLDGQYSVFSIDFTDGIICYARIFSFFSNSMCCYSFSFFSPFFFGSLITSGRLASSTLRYNPFFSFSLYNQFDLQFRQACCEDVNFCSLYHERRPIERCFFYRPPFFTWCWGDPHIRTLDGRRYTFNGLGEYIFANVNGTFETQARTKLATENTTATIFSAFAASDLTPGSDIVQGEIGPDGEMIARINGEDITANLSSVNDTYITMSVMLERIAEDTVSVSFMSSISLEMSLREGTLTSLLKIPEEFNGTVTGLLGNFDGDDTNDLIYRDGTIAPDDIPDREKHVLGQTWQVTQEESLFYYNEGENVSTFSDPNHIPVFLDEIDNDTLSEAIDVCGGDENIECLFDFSQTGNEALAQSTANTNNQNNENEQVIANFPPMIQGPDIFQITINETATYVVNISDPGDTFNVMIMADTGTLPEGYTFTEGEADGEYIFTVTLTEVVMFTFTVAANDSIGASSSIQPQIEICGCENGGNCTTEGTTPSANPRILNCICPEAWEGDFCTVDADGCIEVSCFQDAECIDAPAPQIGAECPPCPVGYIGDGSKCADIDECANSTLNICEQKCINTQGSFMCACNNTGFELNDDEITCSDIDECSNNQHDCDHICGNIVGSFNCSCQNGFILQPDGRTCEVDPDRMCSIDNDCEDLCVLEIIEDSGSGSGDITLDEVCSCMNGFILDDNMENCTDIDECASDSSNPCNQICTNNDGGFECSCMSGFRLESDGFTCVDIQECLQLPSVCNDTQICEDIPPGSFTCSCPPGTIINEQGTCVVPVVFIPSSSSLLLVTPSPSPSLELEFTLSPSPSEFTLSPSPSEFTLSSSPSEFTLSPSPSISQVTSTLIILSPSTSLSLVQTPSPSLVPINEVERQNAVIVTLSDLTPTTFTEERQDAFRNTTSIAINNYCLQNRDNCDIISVTDSRKRDIHQTLQHLSKRQDTTFVSADDIIIIDKEGTAEGLQVTFFVRGSVSGVIPVESVVEAIQQAVDDGVYSTAGFTVTSIMILVTPSPAPQDDDDDGLSDGQIAGIVIGVTIGVLLLVVTTIILFYCFWRLHMSRRLEKGPVKDDNITIDNESFDLSRQKSVRSVKLTFTEVDDSDEEEEKEDPVDGDKEKVIPDESKESNL